MSGAAGLNADAVAVLAGGATLAVVLLVGGIARRGPPARVVSGSAARSPSAAAGAAPTHGWPGRRIAVGTGIVLAAAIAAGPVPAMAVGLLAVVRRRLGQVRARTASQLAVAAALPDAVELLVLCVHAGRSPTQAVVLLAQRAPPPVRPGFVAVERQLHRGQSLADALAELPRALGSGARELAAAISTADREGLPLAPTLDRLAADARATRRRCGEAAAKKLPVQLSFPLVTCVLPAFVLLALAPAVLGAVSSLRGTAL